ncbi:MAG: DUF342 domain-containing protein [Candidatus Sericytochromatia bacterium]|nr:DUF342 domain-containing protein [Candidatus Sericytochromatia bacterium]
MTVRSCGHPVPRYDGNRVTVEPLLSLNAVGLSTGNTQSEHSVIVNGSVEPTCSLWASGDGTVAGVVEAAHVAAGGNVDLPGGVIGHGGAVVTAGGEGRARFIEAATIVASLPGRRG